MDKSPTIFYVMGVSGSGKSTIGKKLAIALHRPFFDGDDFHPETNIAKMSEGKPLDDGDREPWLHRLNHLAKDHLETGAVIACSALKQKYRDILGKGLTPPPCWIYLSGDFKTLNSRLVGRSDHFMPAALLQSQFEALEVPADAMAIDVSLSPEEIIGKILRNLKS